MVSKSRAGAICHLRRLPVQCAGRETAEAEVTLLKKELAKNQGKLAKNKAEHQAALKKTEDQLTAELQAAKEQLKALFPKQS